MGQRLELQDLLETFCNHVYFQGPGAERMQYPCIVYERDNIDIRFANNTPYKHKTRYQITVIDENPDSDIPAKVANLPMCSYDRFFTANNLNHDVFRLFF